MPARLSTMNRAWRIAAGAALMLTACSAPEVQEPSGPSAEEVAAEVGWQPLAESPIGPRTGAHAFWTGSEVLVVGGTDDISCPPGADCVAGRPALRDGAAYDPTTGAWVEMPDAPVPMGTISGATVEGTLYVWAPSFEDGAASAFLSYTPGDDAWIELDHPPFEAGDYMVLVSAGDQLVAVQSTHELGMTPDLGYDPATEQWAELPPDPLAPSFDREMVWTDAGLVLLAHALVPNPGSAEPSVVMAARFAEADETWERLPDSELIGYGFRWSGTAVVNAAIGSADGGQVNNWGRDHPFGGTLDPAAASWSELPGTPEEAGELTGLFAAGGGWTVSGDGWALHDRSSTWVELRRPAAGASEQGQAAVWAGDRLFMFGGTRVAGPRFVLVPGGWAWVPEAR